MHFFWFFLHLVLVILSWFAPFLVRWQIICLVYIGLLLQFKFIGKCVMNAKHGLGDEEHKTFYSDVLEKMGYRPDRRKLKRIIHGYLYWVLMGVTLVWQVVLGNKYLLF
jgi:hypothetical protein